MKRSVTWRARAVLATLVILAVGGCAPARPPEPPEKLTIAAPAVPHTALLHIAAAKGYFAAEGLDVSIVPVSTGPQAVGLVMQGKADVATAAEVVAALAIMKGADLGIVASLFSANEARIVARRDRGISVPADLAGKTLGVTFGTAGEYFLWAYLIRLRLSPTAVSLVNLGPAEIPRALANGAIDATATWQPVVMQAQAALGAANAISFTGDGTYTETHVAIARREFLASHPGAMVKLVRALLRAEAFNDANPEEALQLVAGRLGLAAADLRPFWKDFRFRVDLLQAQLVTLEDEARWAMLRGYAKQGPLPNFLPNLHQDALLAVRSERVTVVR